MSQTTPSYRTAHPFPQSDFDWLTQLKLNSDWLTQLELNFDWLAQLKHSFDWVLL
jgi:hypothetical protein